MLFIKLYKDNNCKAEEVKDDVRVDLLNDDTKDTLDAVPVLESNCTDYFLGKVGILQQ